MKSEMNGEMNFEGAGRAPPDAEASPRRYSPAVQSISVRAALGMEIRRAFLAEEDHQLVPADYSQLELRLLAHVVGEGA